MKTVEVQKAAKTRTKRMLLGERLIEAGLVTKDQLELGLREQKRTGERIGEILINLGFVTQELVSSVLASEAGVTFVQLDNSLIDPAAVKCVSEAMARRYKIIPISLDPPRLTVAMANVFDVLAIDEVQRATGHSVEVVSATESCILQAIDHYYTAGAPSRRSSRNRSGRSRPAGSPRQTSRPGLPSCGSWTSCS